LLQIYFTPHKILLALSKEELLGRPRHRWENVKMDLTEIEREGVNWIFLVQNR
jgi:hypothetical protein